MRTQIAFAPTLLAFLALVAGAPSTPASAQGSAAVDDFAAVAGFLAAPGAGDRAVRIDSLALEVGRGRVRLGSGVLVAARMPGGPDAVPAVAAFIGPATIDYAPERAVEPGELRRLLGEETWTQTVDAVVLVACDGMLGDVFQARAGGDAPAVPAQPVEAVFRALARTFAKSDGDDWAGLVRGLLHGGTGGYRLAAGFRAGHPATWIELDPAEREGSALRFVDKGDKDDVFIVSREEGASGTTFAGPGDDRPALLAEQVNVDATVGDDLEVRQATLIAARAHDAGPAWVPFWLTPDAKVDSVQVDGAAVAWGRLPDAATVWVRLPAGIDRGMATDVRFVTHGKVFERQGDWIALKSSISWLPQHNARQRVPYDLRFRSPKAYRLVSVGDLVETAVEGRQVRSHWVVPRPARNPTFVIGPFDETKLDDPRLPEVTVLMSKSMQREVRATYGEDNVGGDLSKQAIADLANSQKFYRTMFGDPPDTTIVAAEMPYLHGEAFPGLANLTWATFSNVTDETVPMHMRAHEMAHQWWPIGADFTTYRDQWLSEGMADFCALWFAQVSKGDPREYFERLGTWRDELLDSRWRAAGNSDEASPLAMGYRIRNVKGSGVRSTVLYHKGAWVVHMLRAFMLDMRTLRDDRFAAFLRETFRTYRGRSMGTADVRALAEKHAGEELGWFFDQWIDGTAIPTYRWAWRKEKGADGKWKVEVRVAAADVPSSFRMPVPVRIDLGEGRSVRFRVEVEGEKGTSSVEGLDFEPKDVEFNVFASVLSEVKKEAW